MASHSGPSRLALFLFCCMGTLLSVHMASISVDHQEKIIKELKHLSDQLLKDNKEVGIPESSYLKLSFARYCQPPRYINSTAILPYFRAIEPFLPNKIYTEEVIEQLDKIKIPPGPDTTVSVLTGPSDSFDRKRFILTVLREFSACLKSLIHSPGP